MELRDYQIEKANEAVRILRSKNIVYLAMEVRCGKTLTALETIRLYGAKNVLFLTKKKAIKSIENDYKNFEYNNHFELTVTNNESMHKVVGRFDLVVHDESHRFGAFPKPSNGAKMFSRLYGKLPLILLSGTPTPESFSQIFHQFWVSNYSPFPHANFYKWAHDYVNVTQRNLGYGMVNDYTKANQEAIEKVIKPYMVTFTQQQAGFKTSVKENIVYVKMKNITYSLCDRLKKDLVIEGREDIIMADTAVKLMSKLHQLYSGTIKFESGKTKTIDLTKAEFIESKFRGVKIGIFYKFKEELEALKEVFDDNLTTDIEEFDNTDKNIALQIVSGREGISLRNAKYLVYYNMDFSATSYWQSRDRLTTMDRLENEIFYIFTDGGIESKIYKSVINKKNYTLTHFKRDYGIKIPAKDN
jgi:hypothetical protein